MGYAQPGTSPLELVELAQEAERLGYDSAWAAEAWGTDSVTVLSWLAAKTSTIKVGSAIMQIPARTPAMTAMPAATLDLPSLGRLPRFFSPERARDPFGFESRDGFEIAPSVHVVVTDDVEAGRDVVRPTLALYVGGMGAPGANFYNALVARYGYEDEARRIQELYLGGSQREAIAAVPAALVDEAALVGPPERIADRLEVWRESGATTLLVTAHDKDTLRTMAELVL